MDINKNYNSSINFNARLGANLRLNLLKNEFGGSVKHLEKFEKIFNDTFEKKMDTNTVVEITDKGRFRISNPIAPKITYPIKILYNNKSLGQRLLTECDKVYSTTEYRLFQRIISSKVKTGKSLNKISELSKKLDEHSRLYFNDLIGTASRILKENPNSKLTEAEFSDMITTQIREVVETPEFQEAMSSGKFFDAVKILHG